MCPLYPLEESKDATANNKRAPGVAVPEGTTQAVSPCNSGKYDGPEALRCPRLSTDYPLPAGCKDQNRVDGWSASWLICEGSRGPIRSGAKCGGQCPYNMQYLYDRLAKNCPATSAEAPRRPIACAAYRRRRRPGSAAGRCAASPPPA